MSDSLRSQESSVSSAELGELLAALGRTPEVAPPEPDRCGQRLGPYRLLERAGAGGAGVVYRAFDERLRRQVAVKLLRTRTQEPAQRRRLLREARAAAALSHPNVAVVFDAGELEGLPFVALEWLSGGSLRARLVSGGLTATETLTMLRALVAGVAAAHRGGLVHRDLKPENVLFAEDGTPKLVDFGLAQPAFDSEADGEAATAEDTVAEPGQVSGTPGYMAPEQIEGAPVTAATDVFALGVIGFEALVGVRPFRGSTRAGTLVATSRDPAPELPAAVPPSLAAVLRRALEKEPQRRYADGASFAQALAAVQLVTPSRLTGPRVVAVSALVSTAILASVAVAPRGGASSGVTAPSPSQSAVAVNVPSAASPSADAPTSPVQRADLPRSAPVASSVPAPKVPVPRVASKAGTNAPAPAEPSVPMPMATILPPAAAASSAASELLKHRE